MKKLCCYLILICLCVSQTALAEAKGGNVHDMLRDVYAASGLEMRDQSESLEALGREIRQAVGTSGGADFKPGTALFGLLGMLGGDPEKIATRYEMPEDDWDKLWFMLDQGLAQYALDLSASAAGGSDDVDVSARIGAGIDSDGCFAMDGNLLAQGSDGEGTTYTEGDDLYIRCNPKTSEQRVKLPFMDEVPGGAGAPAGDPQSALQRLLGQSLTRDAAHWANAIDMLYARAAGQPELAPLFGYLFEGAPAPGDYALTMDALRNALRRAIRDLSCDMAFIDELSETALMDVVVASYRNDIDGVEEMTPMQRRLTLIAAMSALGAEMDQDVLGSLPEGELRVYDGRVTLSYGVNDRTHGYSRYDDQLDLSYLPVSDGGFELRATVVSSGDTHQLSWSRRAAGNRLSYTLRDGYQTNCVLTLSTDADGFLLECAADPESSYAIFMELSARKTGGLGNFALSGSARSDDELYRLTGEGSAVSGLMRGDFRITRAVPDGMGTEYTLLTADYRAADGSVTAGYRVNADEEGYGAEIASARLDLNWDAEYFNLHAVRSIPSQGAEFVMAGNRSGGVWRGDFSLNEIQDGQSQPRLGGPFTLGPGSLTADLLLMKAPLASITANWSDTAIEAKLDMEGLGQSVELGFDMDPDHLKCAFTVSEGGAPAQGFALSSERAGGARRSQFQLYDPSEPVSIALDSEAEPLDGGWRYTLLLDVNAGEGGAFSVSVRGEDHCALDMSSSEPLTLDQKGTFTVATPEEQLTGSYALNHRVRVDERKHREPKTPQRVSLVNGEPVSDGDWAEQSMRETAIESYGQEPDDGAEANERAGADDGDAAEQESVPQPTLKPVRSFKK